MERWECRKEFTFPPRKYSDMTKVTVVTIYDMGWWKESRLIRETMQAQRGGLSYAVAALCLWVLTDVGQYVCNRVGIHRIRLDKWPTVVKPFADECRRTGQIFGGGKSEIRLAMQMRKIAALAGRTSDDADWEKELKERTEPTTAKRGFDGYHISVNGYHRIREATLRQIVIQAMPTLIRRGCSLSKYWEERWWNTPRGTTSEGGDLKRALKGQARELDLQMRPLKPTVMETRHLKTMVKEINKIPTASARGSTKPEPGMKKRALLALDDTAAFVAGYASDKVEITTKLGGMVLRQDPADVAEWVAFDVGRHVWRVSNDYSNFNILHSLRSMQMIDELFAEAWDKVGSEKWAHDKAAAHRWIAASYNESYIRCPAGEVKVRCGLWSGHRNTARDNTMLHLAYLNCLLSVQRSLFGDFATTSKQRLCGDDETIAYDHWGAAAVHTYVADALGFTSQVSKGMLGRRYDEFLQLLRFPGSIPRYPVAHTMLTFCSGNWYKDPVRNLENTVYDLSSHAWDMVREGFPQDKAQQLCGYVLDYLMQIQDNHKRLVPLEWRSFLGSIPGGHPLWGFTKTIRYPTVTHELPELPLPQAATQDSFKREMQVWEYIGKNRMNDVKKARMWQSYRQVAKNWLQRQYDDAALKVWPRRTITKGTYPIVRHSIPASRWRARGQRDTERSIRAVAKEAGFPPELLGTEEMNKALAIMRPRQRARMAKGMAERQKPTLSWAWELPPLLRAM